MMTSKSSNDRSLKRTVSYDGSDTNDLTVKCQNENCQQTVVLCYSDYVRGVPLTFVLNVVV